MKTISFEYPGPPRCRIEVGDFPRACLLRYPPGRERRRFRQRLQQNLAYRIFREMLVDYTLYRQRWGDVVKHEEAIARQALEFRKHLRLDEDLWVVVGHSPCFAINPIVRIESSSFFYGPTLKLLESFYDDMVRIRML